jgi:hypothetical protein
MGHARSHERIPPVRHLPELDKYEGKWVAVKDGAVVASAQTSRELVAELRRIGDAAEGAVAQFVPGPRQSFMVGVG